MLDGYGAALDALLDVGADLDGQPEGAELAACIKTTPAGVLATTVAT